MADDSEEKQCSIITIERDVAVLNEINTVQEKEKKINKLILSKDAQNLLKDLLKEDENITEVAATFSDIKKNTKFQDIKLTEIQSFLSSRESSKDIEYILKNVNDLISDKGVIVEVEVPGNLNVASAPDNLGTIKKVQSSKFEEIREFKNRNLLPKGNTYKLYEQLLQISDTSAIFAKIAKVTKEEQDILSEIQGFMMTRKSNQLLENGWNTDQGNTDKVPENSGLQDDSDTAEVAAMFLEIKKHTKFQEEKLVQVMEFLNTEKSSKQIEIILKNDSNQLSDPPQVHVPENPEVQLKPASNDLGSYEDLGRSFDDYIQSSSNKSKEFYLSQYRKLVHSKVISADRKSTKYIFKEGISVEEFSDGKKILTTIDGLIQTTYPDGLKTIESPGCQIQYYFPDGQTVVLCNDGSCYIDFGDGSNEYRATDGTLIKTDADGIQIKEFPNDVKEIETGGYKKLEFPDKSVKIFDKTGEHRIIFSTGRIRKMDKDGKVVFDIQDFNTLKDIPSSSGLSKDEIENMIKNPEKYAEQDKIEKMANESQGCSTESSDSTTNNNKKEEKKEDKN